MFQGLIAGALVLALLCLETTDDGARAVGWVAIGAGLIGMGVDIAARFGWL